MSYRLQFIKYLCRLWSDKDIGKWGTSTFKLKGTNDTWLSLSNSAKETGTIKKWDNNPKWMHLVSIDTFSLKQMYPIAIRYDNSSLEEIIIKLVQQVPVVDFEERMKWLQSLKF